MRNKKSQTWIEFQDQLENALHDFIEALKEPYYVAKEAAQKILPLINSLAEVD